MSQSTVQIRIHVRGKGFCDGVLVRADGETLDVDFEPDRCPDMFPGDRRMMYVTGAVFPGQMELDARMVAKERVGRPFRYQFQVDKGACALLSSAKYCRRTFRVASPSEPPVYAVVALVDEGRSFAARLNDVSKLGVSFALPRADAERLGGGEPVTLSFDLPGDDAAFELAGSVRNIGLLPKAVRYGVEIDPERTRDLPATSERLERWVLTSLRRDALATPALRTAS